MEREEKTAFKEGEDMRLRVNSVAALATKRKRLTAMPWLKLEGRERVSYDAVGCGRAGARAISDECLRNGLARAAAGCSIKSLAPWRRRGSIQISSRFSASW